MRSLRLCVRLTFLDSKTRASRRDAKDAEREQEKLPVAEDLKVESRIALMHLVMKSCLVATVLCLFGFSAVGAQTAFQLSILQQHIKPLYRKPTSAELESIAPSNTLLEKYSTFLQQSDTGLTKLVSDAGCADNVRVIVATEDCLKYTMPGAGNSYSFRLDNYRIPSLADVIYTDDSFQASGVLLHGIFVNIGDVPLEKTTLRTNGLKYLINFVPVAEFEDAKQVDEELTEGITRDGFVYRRGLFAVENTTFVLRSIAYKGSHYRAVRGVTYNELSFDKRADVIVAFRIVEKGPDGSVTILWKEMARKKAPKMSGGRRAKRL